jgi:hypothetical protein
VQNKKIFFVAYINLSLDLLTVSVQEPPASLPMVSGFPPLASEVAYKLCSTSHFYNTMNVIYILSNKYFFM